MKFYFILFVALERAVSVFGELCLEVATSSIQSRQRAVNLRSHLQNIWESLPVAPQQKAVRSFRKRLQSCVRADGEHFEHLFK